MRQPIKTSWTISAFSLLAMSLLTFSVAIWTGSFQDGQPRTVLNPRKLQSKERISDVPNDDAKRDGICKEYLYNFLNGTTDAKDECDGMLNAFQAADCVDDKNIFKFYFGKKHRAHVLDDDNTTQDDVLIDDYVENFECCSSIYSFYSKNCRPPQLASFRLLGIMGILVICGIVKSLIRTFQLEWMPDAGACILVGAFVGGIVTLINPHLINEKLTFDNDLFLHIMLPPIIFQSSLNIDKRAFRRDLFPILTFAILGTVFSAVVIGLLTHTITSWGHGTTLPLLDSLLFGSLISSIDPVATLGILSGVGLGQSDTLYTLVFGESLLNDGVAIVMFDTLVKHLGDATVVNKATIHECLTSFLMVTFCSIGIGLACGIVCTAYFWALRKRHTAVTEVAIFFCWALIPFYISDGVGFSGIISIMTMGFFVDYFVIGGSQSEEEQWMAYMALRDASEGSQTRGNFSRAFSGRGHLSSTSKHHVGFVAEVVASIMETAIFAYLGVFLFSDKHFWDMRLNATAVFGCFASRGVMVMMFSMVVNFFVWLDIENRISRVCFPQRWVNEDRDSADSMGSTAPHAYLDRDTQKILLLAGVRGAVSFALVENIPVYDAVRKTGSQVKAELKGMAGASILFTVFVFGALTHYVVKKIKEDESGARTGTLIHRLLDTPLDSDNEDEVNGSFLQLESTVSNQS